MSLWKFRLEQTEVISFGYSELLDKYGKVSHVYYRDWFVLHINQDTATIVIRKGYAWDGCTPKFRLFGRLFGVWDGFFNLKTHRQDTYYASLVHDTLCQFMAQHPFKREDVDKVFLHLAKRDNFIFAYPYYWAIRLFALLFRKEQ